MENNQALLQQIKLGDLTLKNRVIMAPMTRNRATNEENTPIEMHATYYKQRSGAGLIITEGSQISKRAVGYIGTPGIYSNSQVEGWKKVTKAVHEEDGKIFLQLWHTGRMSHVKFHNGNKPLAPSPVNAEDMVFTPDGFEATSDPREMTIEEILETVQEFKNAAANAKTAGFDGVEIHASNGYLIHQFFNKNSNTRTDNYGGSIENRTRFMFEVLDAVKEVWDENRIGVRLNPSLHKSFGITATQDTIPTFDYIVEKLNGYNLSYLHLSEPFPEVKDVDFLVDDIAKHYRPIYHGNLIINAGFDRESGNKVIDEGFADMVSFGKPFISNPDLPHRFAENAHLTDGDQDTFYGGGKEGYIDYPTLEEEKQRVEA